MTQQLLRVFLKVLFNSFFVFIIISTNYILPAVFAQGREYQRSRSLLMPGQGVAVSGEAIPSVEYFIAAQDSLEIFVWQNPDVSKNVIVGPDGKISYPLVGRVEAAGKTIGQLEKEITEKLSKYIKSPQVSIMVTQFAGDKIIVLGEVAYPGIYTFSGMISLLDALALAGDFTEKARRDSVLIVRGNLTKKPEVIRIDLFRILSQGTSDTNIILKPNDAIYVPRSYIHNFNKFLENIMPTINDASAWINFRSQIRTLGGHSR